MSLNANTTKTSAILAPSSTVKPSIVGLYGIPGSGKSTLLAWLKKELGQDDFAFYDGSEVIDSVCFGGLPAFKKLPGVMKEHWRKVAINKIKESCMQNKVVGVVTGHYMFWAEDDEEGETVITSNDLDTFTHILYLNVPASTVAQRRQDDRNRTREAAKASHLEKWQDAEKAALRRLCYQNGILFSCVSLPDLPTLPQEISMLLQDFKINTTELNLSRIISKLDSIVENKGTRETFLVLDADRTLAAVDTGCLFWNKLSKYAEDPLKMIFSSSMGYSYDAFRQAALLYGEVADTQDIDALCQDVADEVKLYPEFVSLLHTVADQDHIGAIVVTCGLGKIWEKVLSKAGLSESVNVIGGGCVVDGIVVTPSTKAAVVKHLQCAHNSYIWAVGDSPVDLEMLHQADKAIVVTGNVKSRSKTMDQALKVAIEDGLKAKQVLIPSNATPRLDTVLMPLIDLKSAAVLDEIIQHHEIRVHCATDNVIKILMSTMRDAKVAGPALRSAHHRVGWYLTTQFLADLIGVEEYPIHHVSGHEVAGYRLFGEQKTTIVALMRGGEPMALGVSDALPLAMFVHAKDSNDMKLHHLQGQETVVLVDSVVNSGKTVVEFVEAIRKLNSKIRIVVVAGVVQEEAVSKGSLKALGHRGDLSLVTLRLSENKYTGSGTTDTGNRLFNTTHLA